MDDNDDNDILMTGDAAFQNELEIDGHADNRNINERNIENMVMNGNNMELIEYYNKRMKVMEGKLDLMLKMMSGDNKGVNVEQQNGFEIESIASKSINSFVKNEGFDLFKVMHGNFYCLPCKVYSKKLESIPTDRVVFGRGHQVSPDECDDEKYFDWSFRRKILVHCNESADHQKCLKKWRTYIFKGMSSPNIFFLYNKHQHNK